ncbi:MAG: phospho-sugar mutase, partial [Actinomycetota bacterium]
MTDPIDDDTRAAIARWIDLDGEHGPALAELLAQDPAAAAALFDGRIAFGTAGLRAEMGPGPRRMNRLVVRQTTAGLMSWLPDGATVVIGYDARHHSHRFARDVAEVVAEAGGRALVIDRPAPTPVLALAVLDHGANAGVMITASHNPAADNGYKLYLGDGIQLVAPADAEIAAAIDAVAADDDHPVAVPAAAPDITAPDSADRDTVARGTAEIGESRFEDISEAALVAHRAAAVAALSTGHRDVRVLYTAMHGVGGRHLLDCFEAAGFPPPALVASQFDPDPEFPTAPFPNPEEPGAFDHAFDTAAAAGAGAVDVILANDPDADRLAVGVLDDGRWRRLSGDEVGALLVDHVLRHGSAGGDGDGDRGNGGTVVASSIVSSRFIDTLAEAYGATSIRTLTGFKWVARPIVDRPDDRYAMGYEEALGYCIGDRVRDKDGISAALVLAELAAGCLAEGTTLVGRLDELIERHGLWATGQVTVGVGHLDDAGREEVKATAVSLDPDEVAGVAVTGREDLAEGRILPPTSGVVLELADRSRVIVRPSGTEPKIKAYLEV